MDKTRFLRIMLVGIVAFGILTPWAYSEAKEGHDKAEKWLQRTHAEEDRIIFFGEVLDQYGQAVVGAEVLLSLTKASVLPSAPESILVVTDSQGRFQVDQAEGSALYVQDIRLAGYEVVFEEDTARSFNYRKDRKPRYIPNRAKPVTFLMRKKGENPAFLLGDEHLQLSVKSSGSGKPLGYDFIRRHHVQDAHLVFDGEPLTCDLQVKATFNENDATWTAVLSPGNTNGGIIVSEQLLYEAPDTGYQPEYTFTPEDRKPLKAKYVYLKSRDPAIYTRLEIQYINANKQFFRLSGKSVTNPYGDRNLEQATDLPYEVTKQLTNDAKAAFRQNKRPAKADLKALIKAEKEKKK